MEKKICSIKNGQSLLLCDIPHLSINEFRDIVCKSVKNKKRLSALFCVPTAETNSLFAVLADNKNAVLNIVACDIDKEYPALTPDCMQAHLFEREIYENFGIIPKGHPWLKPVRFSQNSLHPDDKIGKMNFFQMEGKEIHEVAVGPVHAGVIEPGHFRFQCHGEIVYNLEISLGYQHRGIERAFPKESLNRQIHLIETVSGDSTAGHTIAYCNIIESLCDCHVTARSQAIRGIALELERIACHIGDLGALSGDVGFLPTSAYCGRIRGNILNMTAVLCGNRFSRNLIRPGGVKYDLDSKCVDQLLEELKRVRKDTANAIELLFDTPSALGRFEGTGKVSSECAQRIGMVGPAARATGIEEDVRHDFSAGIYQYHHIPISTAKNGDVLARAMVRWIEIQRSFVFVEEMLKSMPVSKISSNINEMQPNKVAIALTEGWRGEICHIATTDNNGKIENYKIIDPSFHNWFGLALALRNEQISDFPVCNKSFNLSYCGFDL